MDPKTVVANLTKGEKLRMEPIMICGTLKSNICLISKITYLEHLTTVMDQPDEGTTAQHRRDLDAYIMWVKKDCSTRFILLRSMHNDLIGTCEKCPTAKSMWDELKVAYGDTSTTRFRAMTLKFDKYRKDPKHTMSKHLRVVKDMIQKLGMILMMSTSPTRHQDTI
ncbi:hypothetical protein NE237_004586 [Protea cynaroides]|uniref:Uncharacterized protein n=1 Tax=Protea cynaroides TaxID=273540 RepID=A0A9Q0QTR2_9MAGN|nr:hypothetical protein NE237_004586 [Protea cynaroides]